jgi:hypothetical protein
MGVSGAFDREQGCAGWMRDPNWMGNSKWRVQGNENRTLTTEGCGTRVLASAAADYFKNLASCVTAGMTEGLPR